MKPFLVFLFSLLYGQMIYAQRTIVGKVTDCEREPLREAIIIIKGTNIGTQTNQYGDYQINIPEERDTDTQALVFEYIGKETQTICIQGQDTIQVRLEEAPASCVFYGIIKYE